MHWRRIRNWLLTIGVVVTSAIAVTAWVVGSALVAPANRMVGPPPDNFPAARVDIPSASGTTIAAWHMAVPDSHSTVILLHSIRGDRRSMLSRAQLLHEQGYSTLLVDLRGHGESPGDSITLGYLERHDVLASVDFVRRHASNQKIAIIGNSLGGASTLLAVPDVDLIVVESVYPTVSEAVHNRIAMRLGVLHHVIAPLLLIQLKPRLGISPDELCPIDQLKNIRCPILIASGDRDQHTTIEETRRIFDAANEPKRIVIFEGAEHVDLFAHDPTKYKNEIIDWLNEALADR